MRNLCLLVALGGRVVLPLSAQQPAGLDAALRNRIAQDTATVAVAYFDAVTRDTLLINGRLRFHAASTMKVPVLIELARRIDEGEMTWDDTVLVTNHFHSLADGSDFSLSRADDSDSTMYEAIGRSVPTAELARLMIARSSNLATNLLLERLQPARVTATARALGADSIDVLRGVEHAKAYNLGLNNTTTARDLAVLMDALVRGRAATPTQTEKMLDFLLAQEFNNGIPAGVPNGVRVAHKTGWITATAHDAAIIFPPDRGPYVLVVLTRGFPAERDAERLMADLSELAYRWATRHPDPHE